MRHRYRRGVGFVLDMSRHATKLDRNEVARILYACEVLERRTKARRCRNGILGLPAIIVLRALLMRFHNRSSGLCFPSYDAIGDATGLCRASIARALANLERARVLVIKRRLQRYRDPATGAVACRQGSNIYGFRQLPALVPLVRERPKPQPHALAGLFPRVHEVGRNDNRGSSMMLSEALHQGFSREAVLARRVKAGLQ